MKCVRKNIHKFILLPSFLLSFRKFHSYICIDPLIQIRCGRCGMNSYHKIACEQFNRNWLDSFLTTSSIKLENTTMHVEVEFICQGIVRDLTHCSIYIDPYYRVQLHPFLIYYHVIVYTLLYYFYYVHILYLRYSKVSYMKKITSELIVLLYL